MNARVPKSEAGEPQPNYEGRPRAVPEEHSRKACRYLLLLPGTLADPSDSQAVISRGGAGSAPCHPMGPGQAAVHPESRC